MSSRVQKDEAQVATGAAVTTGAASTEDLSTWHAPAVTNTVARESIRRCVVPSESFTTAFSRLEVAREIGAAAAGSPAHVIRGFDPENSRIIVGTAGSTRIGPTPDLTSAEQKPHVPERALSQTRAAPIAATCRPCMS